MTPSVHIGAISFDFVIPVNPGIRDIVCHFTTIICVGCSTSVLAISVARKYALTDDMLIVSFGGD
jgi:hypothetical protein